MTNIEIICHRGFWQKRDDQNRLASFKKAIESGFGFETDVRDSGSNMVIPRRFTRIMKVKVYLDLYHSSLTVL